MPESAVDSQSHFPPGTGRALRELNQDGTLMAYAWELARIPAGLDEAARRDLGLVALALLATLGQGHTRLDLDQGGMLAALGRKDLEPRALLADPRLAGIVGRPGDARPLIVAGRYLYSQRLLAVETGFAARVRAMLDQPPPAEAPVPEALFTDPVPLNREQRAAVTLALRSPLALITGGPGTGKTSIVVAMLRALLCQPGMDGGLIALAAPTGKAAQRMGEAVRAVLVRLQGTNGQERERLDTLPEPQTLHRLLSWHPALERFRHDEGNPLGARVVVVDEASMVGQELMDRLFRALAPGARIVLLGDADQLPSVEGGCAFRDLVAALAPRTRRLTESYRMRQDNPAGRAILAVAQAVNAGAAVLEPLRELPGMADWHGEQVELLPGERGPEAFLDRWFREVVVGLKDFPLLANRVYRRERDGWGPGDEAALGLLFAHFDRFRILCALRETADLRGVAGVNRLLHQWMFARTGAGLRRETPFYAGEPVMMTSNDYRRGLFNGDQGLVLKVAFQGELRQGVGWSGPEGFRAFPLDALRAQLDLCYAMTVHKAQGSEYERIAVLLPRTDHPALTRELLYTAITRARKSVTLVGERERLAWAAGNPTRRDTGLQEALSGPPAAG